MRSIGALEWFGKDEVSFGDVASALNQELARRGLPLLASVPDETPFVRGSGMAFEEKLIPPADGFAALCDANLSPEEIEVLCGWTVLVPIDLREEVWLSIPSGAAHESIIAGAPQVLALAHRLATAIDLPDEVPTTHDNLDLTCWFRDEAPLLAARRPGPWSVDLDAAFYVALFFRAAQHSIRRGSPLICR